MKGILLEKIKKSLLYIILVSHKYYKKLNGIENFDNSQELEDFTPKILTKEEDKYSESLKYSIDNPNTKNVALTGAYGSGKSSILKTFEKKYFEYGYLNISLATFNENKQDIKEIEFCILKQLFYKVEQSKIPESRFKRIENHRFVKFKTFLFLLWIISFVHYCKTDLLKNAIELFHVNFYSEWTSMFYFSYFTLGICFLFYKLMGFVLNFKLTKFSFQNTEIENGDTKKSKDFENEIDEILYFFERNPINVVFIEDLDRFKNTNIFIKLREINFLINNYDPIKKVKKVTFVYAVQDDTFKNDERTKFFDFIIPVIPVINYSNSGTELLNKIDITADKIEKAFIDEVSLYLSDKRTLISIVNEYKIYKKIIGKNLDKKKLLAMMIYKNIEPTDFDNLNKQKGYVYDAFSNSDRLTKDKIATFDKKIKELENEKTEINAVNLEDVKELRSLYILEFYKRVSPGQRIHSFYINNSSCSADQLTSEDSKFEEFSKSTNIEFYYNYSNITNQRISFKELEDNIGSYQLRAKQIKNKSTTYLNEIKTKIEYYKTEKQSIKSKNFSLLMKENDTVDYLSEIEKINPLQNKNLVNYLLRYGHIDESYAHYISHFYEGSISKKDNDFLLCFTNGTTLPFSHKLEELDVLFPKLKAIPDYFDRIQILNYSLLDYLIKNRRKKANDELQRVIKLIIINTPHQFIDDYINYAEEKNSKEFIIELNSQWNIYSESGFWSEISPVYTLERLKFYLNLMFSCAENKKVSEFINRFDIEQQILVFLSELEDLDYFEENKSKLIEFIDAVKICFKNLNITSNKEILDFIYNNSHYEINKKMITLFLNLYAKNAIDLELLKTANYTTIKNSGASKLIQYVNLNLESYIKTIFLQLENNCNESEEVIIDLLNADFGPELSIEILNKNQTPISDISKIKESNLWTKLLQGDKIAVTWDNLLCYFKEKEEFNETLVDYLNKEEHFSELSKIKINKNFDEENSKFVAEFIRELITSQISLDSFKRIMTFTTIPYHYPDGTAFNNIADEKIKILIQNKILKFSTQNFNFIEHKFKDLLLLFLEANKDVFMKSIGDYTLDSSIILKLIDSVLFNSEQKMAIVDNTPEDILMENQNITKKVCHLLSMNPKTQVSIKLLKELLAQSQSIEDKIKFFNLYYIDYNESELENIIELLGEPYSKITKGKRPQFDNNSYNLDFVTKMKDIFIRNFDIVDNNRFIQTSSKKASKI